MIKNPSILYLYAVLDGYVIGVLKELVKKTNGTIDVVFWDSENAGWSKYKVGAVDGIIFHKRSLMDAESILGLLLKRQPNILVVSGWMDRDYIAACKIYKKINPCVKIVPIIDDQWTGSLRQHLGRIYFALFFRKLFDCMWVTGKPQYSYAERFGYDISNIISNSQSADTSEYDVESPVCRRFIFVGRFVKVKAIDLLLEAYNGLPLDVQSEWPLLLIGAEERRVDIRPTDNPCVQVLPFMQPKDLRVELSKGGVGCLPSHKDQWGVVVHEFALLGLPMVISSGVGAATEYLIPGYNGYLFEKGSVESLRGALLKITQLTDDELFSFGHNSRALGRRVNCEISAASLLSIVQ
jgi:glycosyltransferase involved in cell wall biosynthesis